MELKLVFLLVAGIALAAAAKDPEAEPDNDNNFDQGQDQEGRQVYFTRYRRPMNLQIRVPFFQMYLKRRPSGPSNLGLQVFPDSHYGGGLVNVNHRWWGKK